MLRDRWDEYLDNLQSRFGTKRVVMVSTLLIIGLASLVIQLLIRTDYDSSALLYLAVPYSVAVLITMFRPYQIYESWWRMYISHSVTALVVFLSSSMLLFEGFICVIFFMPIYFAGVTLAFIAHWISVSWNSKRSKTYASAIPLLIAVLSLEGTSDVTSFNREQTVVVVAETELPPPQLLKNLGMPIDLPNSDNWMLGVFPMPHRIEAGSLKAGDIHRVHTRYHRWFVANTHEGEIQIRIESVSPDQVTTSIVRDTSYFSSYINLIGSEFKFDVDAQGRTHISLAVRYERRLDPAWYFHPIQQYAIEQMAQHLIKEVLTRE